MARQNPARQGDSNTATEQDEAPVSTEQEQAPTEATEASTEAEAEAEPEPNIDAFKSVLAEVVATRDESTGEVSEENLARVTVAYRELDGLKPKNMARDHVEGEMITAVTSLDGPLARAFADSKKALKAGGTTKRESTPADPTSAFVGKVAALRLADSILQSQVPSGVSEDWAAQVEKAVAEAGEQVQQYRTWLETEPTEGEEKPAAPEVSPAVRQAFRLVSGKGTGSASRGGSLGGPRRDIGKHISEVFSGVESGTELTVAEIANTATSEYPAENPPSQGAVSARLFPNSGKCTIEGITPLDKGDGKPRRARKN